MVKTILFKPFSFLLAALFVLQASFALAPRFENPDLMKRCLDLDSKISNQIHFGKLERRGWVDAFQPLNGSLASNLSQLQLPFELSVPYLEWLLQFRKKLPFFDWIQDKKLPSYWKPAVNPFVNPDGSISLITNLEPLNTGLSQKDWGWLIAYSEANLRHEMGHLGLYFGSIFIPEDRLPTLDFEYAKILSWENRRHQMSSQQPTVYPHRSLDKEFTQGPVEKYFYDLVPDWFAYSTMSRARSRLFFDKLMSRLDREKKGIHSRWRDWLHTLSFGKWGQAKPTADATLHALVIGIGLKKLAGHFFGKVVEKEVFDKLHLQTDISELEKTPSGFGVSAYVEDLNRYFEILFSSLQFDPEWARLTGPRSRTSNKGDADSHAIPIAA